MHTGTSVVIAVVTCERCHFPGEVGEGVHKAVLGHVLHFVEDEGPAPRCGSEHRLHRTPHACEGLADVVPEIIKILPRCDGPPLFVRATSVLRC